jgi:hypothetical protein
MSLGLSQVEKFFDEDVRTQGLFLIRDVEGRSHNLMQLNT